MGGGGDVALSKRSPAQLGAIPWTSDAGVAVGSAIIASGSITPFILTIDKAVVQATAGEMSLMKATWQGVCDCVLRPRRLLMSVPLWMVWGVYGSTYIAANLSDVYFERNPQGSAGEAIAKLVGTTIVNMSASLVKDVTFAKMFGKQAEKAVGEACRIPTKRVPMATYGLFLTRDTLTIAGGFTVPPLVSKSLQHGAGMDRTSADRAAQLISPMGMQLLCTPLHLGALNMYNEPNATVGERMQQLGRVLPSTTAIRMVRFLGAYGIGGLTNKALIARGREWNEKSYAAV